MQLFDQLVGETHYVGEIGLDGAPEFKKSWGKQIQVFDHILTSCSEAGGRILSIHSRRAVRAVLELLSENPNAGIPVLHWFTGTKSELNHADQLGCWFSVGPPMMRSGNARDLIARMPRDRILTESDGPFARYKNQPVYPWDTNLAVRGLAELWDCDESFVEDKLNENLKVLASTRPT